MARGYYEKHGNLWASRAIEEEKDVNTWVNEQRRQYKKEGHGRLDEDQVRLLEEIHIENNQMGHYDKQFVYGVEAFRKYVMENNDNLVHTNYVTEDGFALGRWLSHKREQYHRGRIAADRIAALDDAGMEWESTETVMAIRYWKMVDTKSGL